MPGGTDRLQRPGPAAGRGPRAALIRAVLLSDTHVPSRAKDLPPALWRAIDVADVVVHAGDWTDGALVAEITRRAGRLVGVAGNNDGPDIDLPEVAYADLGGLRLAVLHDTGPATGRERRMAARFPDTDLLVFGHSHIPWDTTAESGLRLVNPGSPTDRRRQPYPTWVTASVEDGRLKTLSLRRGSAGAPRSGDRTPGSA